MEKEETGKKTYATPRLTVYGDLSHLTKTKGGSRDDARAGGGLSKV